MRATVENCTGEALRLRDLPHEPTPEEWLDRLILERDPDHAA